MPCLERIARARPRRPLTNEPGVGPRRGRGGGTKASARTNRHRQPKREAIGSFPMLDLEAAGVRDLAITLPVRLKSTALDGLRKLAGGGDRSLVVASCTYTRSRKRHGATATVTIESGGAITAEIRYRLENVPRPTKATIGRVWDLLQHGTSAEPIRALVAARAPIADPKRLPIQLPYAVPGLDALGSVTGLNIDKMQDGKWVYSLYLYSAGTLPTVQAVFTREVVSVAAAPEDLLSAAQELVRLLIPQEATRTS